jgi:hypothetical protein
MKIFKYTLKAVVVQKVVVPRPGRILSVVNQNEKIVLYVMVNDNASSTYSLEIIIYGTGHEIKGNTDHLLFLDTVNLSEGDLMFHVFLRRKGGLNGVE